MPESDQRRRPFVGWVVVLVLLLLPPLLFAVLGLSLGHSHILNNSWITQVDAAFAGGLFPPRHLPGLWGGLGGLDFFFYGPLPYWFSAVVRAFACPACSAVTAFALSGGIALSLSGIAFVVIAWRFVPFWSAVAGAAVYMVLPYHVAVDWVWRQAAGEFYAYIFVPLVAAGMDVVLRERRLSALLPLAFAGLCLTHLPTALLAGHVFFAVFVAWAFRARANPSEVARAFLRLIGLVALGAALSAFFWLPALALLGDVSPQALFDPHFQAYRNLVGGSFTGLHAEPEMLASMLVAPLAVLWLYRLPKASRPEATGLWTVVPVVVASFLMVELSAPIWKHWIIASVQFPWRMLLFSDLSAGLAAAIVARAVMDGIVSAGGARMAMAVLIAVNAFVVTGRSFTIDATADPVARDAQVGAPEYLPPDMYGRVTDQGNSIRRILERLGADGGGGFLDQVGAAVRGVEEFTLSSRRATAVPIPGASELLLPMPFWRHWQGQTADGTPLVLAPDPDFGMTLVGSADGTGFSGPVILDLPWHWSERQGLRLTIAGIVGLIALATLGLWRRRLARRSAIHQR